MNPYFFLRSVTPADETGQILDAPGLEENECMPGSFSPAPLRDLHLSAVFSESINTESLNRPPAVPREGTRHCDSKSRTGSPSLLNQQWVRADPCQESSILAFLFFLGIIVRWRVICHSQRRHRIEHNHFSENPRCVLNGEYRLLENRTVFTDH